MAEETLVKFGLSYRSKPSYTNKFGAVLGGLGFDSHERSCVQLELPREDYLGICRDAIFPDLLDCEMVRFPEIPFEKRELLYLVVVYLQENEQTMEQLDQASFHEWHSLVGAEKLKERIQRGNIFPTIERRPTLPIPFGVVCNDTTIAVPPPEENDNSDIAVTGATEAAADILQEREATKQFAPYMVLLYRVVDGICRKMHRLVAMREWDDRAVFDKFQELIEEGLVEENNLHVDTVVQLCRFLGASSEEEDPSVHFGRAAPMQQAALAQGNADSQGSISKWFLLSFNKDVQSWSKWQQKYPTKGHFLRAMGGLHHAASLELKVWLENLSLEKLRMRRPVAV